jgi:hypothetical protein
MDTHRNFASPRVGIDDRPAHGPHCYDADGVLICGWPELHPEHTQLEEVYEPENFDPANVWTVSPE